MERVDFLMHSIMGLLFGCMMLKIALNYYFIFIEMIYLLFDFFENIRVVSISFIKQILARKVIYIHLT